jgi:3-deoxy-D-manno-octulosonic-acid transferase
MVISELLYLLGVKLYGLGIFLFSFFNKKAALWVEGRKHNLSHIRKSLRDDEKRIWFHCPSLGEFEQGRPVLQAIRKAYPEHKIVLTFFSPSGFEVRKNDRNGDYIFYMPLDGPYNSLTFINLVKPEMAFFVKYDFWHFYIKILKEKKIQSYFISCIFRPSQIYFKWYGFFFEKILRRVSHLFVQNQASLELLYKNSIPSVSVSGDTRFDRVYENSLVRKENPHIKNFKNGRQLFIAGSSWPEDDYICTDVINENKYKMKWIIAPHEIKEDQITQLEKSLTVTHIRYSQITNETNLFEKDVLIIDNVGMLSGLYAEADVAFIGGGFGKGIHNILEAAVYGIPVIFGPKYEKFQEAKDLVSRKGAFCIRNAYELRMLLDKILPSADEIERIKNVNTGYVMENKGATEIIMNYLKMNH